MKLLILHSEETHTVAIPPFERKRGGGDLLTPHICKPKQANVRRRFASAKLREGALSSAKAQQIILSHFEWIMSDPVGQLKPTQLARPSP